jgi:hypothetical protein
MKDSTEKASERGQRVDYATLLRERAAQCAEREPEAPLTYLDARNRDLLSAWRMKMAREQQ